MDLIKTLGLEDPALCVCLFLAASLLMVWRLEALLHRGLEGTALGALVTPYCSGLGNLLFVYFVFRDKADPAQVVTNCLVNNITNLTLVLGVPALLWGLNLGGKAAGKSGTRKGGGAGKRDIEQRISRLSLLFTLGAAGFFSAVFWVLGADGLLDFNDGLILTGLFLFWQAMQVVDVLKHNVRQSRSFDGLFYLDLGVLLVGAVAMYASLEWLVSWLGSQKGGFICAQNLGWLSGWLMVLPNAVLALYYGFKRRADVAYASQVGDGHICIPFCLGLFALLKPLRMPALFETGLLVLVVAIAVHFLLVLLLRGLPRWLGWVLVAGYAVFLWAGLGS